MNSIEILYNDRWLKVCYEYQGFEARTLEHPGFNECINVTEVLYEGTDITSELEEEMDEIEMLAWDRLNDVDP